MNEITENMNLDENRSFARTEMLLGKEAMRKLAASKVAVFGIGGVGGYVCEALVRSGIGFFELIDSDTVSETNLNRQIIATTRTIGRRKTEVMKERMLEINPLADIRTRDCFFLPETADSFDFSQYDYVVDAVDTVTAKLLLAEKCQSAGVKIISSMGTGNKLNPAAFRVADIYQTKICPLARVMRKECRSRGIERLKVVYSEEMPVETGSGGIENGGSGELPPPGRRAVPGSTAFVPGAAGLLIASEVVRDLIS